MNTKEMNWSHQNYDAQSLPPKLQSRESNTAPLAHVAGIYCLLQLKCWTTK